MPINKQEFKEIKSAILAVSYQEEKNHYTHASNPFVYITVREEYKKSKYSKVKLKLFRSISEMEIVLAQWRN